MDETCTHADLEVITKADSDAVERVKAAVPCGAPGVVNAGIGWRCAEHAQIADGWRLVPADRTGLGEIVVREDRLREAIERAIDVGYRNVEDEPMCTGGLPLRDWHRASISGREEALGARG